MRYSKTKAVLKATFLTLVSLLLSLCVHFDLYDGCITVTLSHPELKAQPKQPTMMSTLLVNHIGEMSSKYPSLKCPLFPGARCWNQILDLSIMSQVLYHCVTTTGPETYNLLYDYLSNLFKRKRMVCC